MKHLTTLLLLALLPFMAYAQTADIIESLRMLDNSQADVMYSNEFGSFRNPDLDDPFPYVVIKVELSGDVAQAKRMLSLDLGTMYKVEARNTNKDNMILFLIRSSARSIHLLCGDGCDRQELYYGTLIMNKVYSCKVQYSAKKQTAAASNDEMAEMKKQVAEMKQLFLNQQQGGAANVKTPRLPGKYNGVIISDGTLQKVPKDFTGEFVIPDYVTRIGYAAFDRCSRITSVTIPNSVIYIDDYAFDSCLSLTNVTIPDGVTSIGKYAFRNCKKLTSMTIPNSVTSIGKYAFCNCKTLTSMTIPNSVTSIEDGAFDLCSGLTSVTIPNSVTSIGDFAICGCTGLTSVTFQSSQTKLEDEYIFYDCPNLQAIYVPAGTKKYYQKMLPSKQKKLVVEQ